MKKILLLIPTILFPYLLLFFMFCIFTGFLMEELFDNFFLVMIFYLMGYFVITFALILAYIILSRIRKWDPKEMAKINMIVKAVQIPAYLAIFILGLICSLTIFTIGFTIAFIIYDIVSIFLTGIIGASTIMRLKVKNQRLASFYIINGILQFIFCVDVVSSFIVYNSIGHVSNVVSLPSNDEESKKEFPLISFVSTLTVNILLCLVLIISEVLFPLIDDFSGYPLWYKLLTYATVIIMILGVVMSCVFRNRANTKPIELVFEVLGFFMGIAVMLITVIVFSGTLGERIIFSLITMIVSFSFCFGISTTIGLLKRAKKKNVQSI